MFESHPNLTPPPDNTVLWRYMDFPKFLAIVAQRELYFVSLPQLNDPFEGHIPRPLVDSIRQIPPNTTIEERNRRRQVADHNIAAIQYFRQDINVSCWHMNDTESDAMWKLYMPSGQGIAIRTNFAQFRKAFNGTLRTVHGGVVRYVDYETHRVDFSNIYNWTILKRRSFAHENEFRAFVSEPPVNAHGVAVEINSSELIESVFVSPMAPSWHVELLRKLLSTYDLNVPVIQSDLYQQPMYYNAPSTMDASFNEGE